MTLYAFEKAGEGLKVEKLLRYYLIMHDVLEPQS